MTPTWHDPDNDGAYYERFLPGPLPLRLSAWDKRTGGAWDWGVALLMGGAEWSLVPYPRTPCANSAEAKAAAEAWARAALEKALGGICPTFPLTPTATVA